MKDNYYRTSILSASGREGSPQKQKAEGRMLAKVATCSVRINAGDVLYRMAREHLNAVTAMKTHQQKASGQEDGILGFHGDMTFGVNISHLSKELP